MPVYLRPSSVIDWDDVPSASQYDVALAAAGADLNVGGVAVKEAVSGGSQLAVPEGNYVIQVRSKDSNGVSEWTAPLAVVVKLGPPPPTNVTVV
jgi:hypothetical protein